MFGLGKLYWNIEGSQRKKTLPWGGTITSLGGKTGVFAGLARRFYWAEVGGGDANGLVSLPLSISAGFVAVGTGGH
jgi:hypothetical protein